MIVTPIPIYLTEPTPAKRGFWERLARVRIQLFGFFNSALGIWFLSSVVVSGLSYLYSESQERAAQAREVAAERREAELELNRTIAKLDQEISYRLSSWLVVLDRVQRGDKNLGLEVQDPNDLKPATVVAMIALPPYAATDKPVPVKTLYAEYERSTLLSLVADLRRLEHEQLGLLKSTASSEQFEHQRLRVQDLDEVAGHIADPERLFNRMPLDFPKKAGQIEWREVQAKGGGYGPISAHLFARSVQKRILLDRWRNSPFSYTDCNQHIPFC